MILKERCKGVHCVDLGESFPTNIYLQNLGPIQPRTDRFYFFYLNPAKCQVPQCVYQRAGIGTPGNWEPKLSSSALSSPTSWPPQLPDGTPNQPIINSAESLIIQEPRYPIILKFLQFRQFLNIFSTIS